MRKCLKCQEEKELTLFRKYSRRKSYISNTCKTCINQEQKLKRQNLSEEERRVISSSYKETRKRHKQILNFNLNNNLIPIEKRIKLWIGKRTRDGEKSLDKKNLSLDLLFEKSKKALERFPYIVFLNKRDSGIPMNCCASIDRINNSIGYEDNNSVVVPLWLNLAKGIGTYDELYQCIKDFLEYENL